MSFELWLFTIKRLAQTMDAAKLIYDGLGKAEQDELRREYEAYIGVKSDAPATSADSTGDFAPLFTHFNDDILFGENWNNTDIDIKTRSIITVVALIVAGITDVTLNESITNAKNNGVSQKEIAAIITHTAFYAGWPNARAALNIAKEVYG